MTTVYWTTRAQADLAAIYAFVELDSPHFAKVVVRRLIEAVERLKHFPQSGRSVPEYSEPAIREVILAPYRVVYRVLDADTVHILTVHHGARSMPHQVPDEILRILSGLLHALAELGYEPIRSRYDSTSFGNFIVDLASGEYQLQIVRDRLQFHLGETGDVTIDELKRVGLFRAFDDLPAFQTAVLSFLRARK